MKVSLGWAVLPVWTDEEARGKTFARWSRHLFAARAEAEASRWRQPKRVLEVFIEIPEEGEP